MPSLKSLFYMRCFLNGVERAKWDELWLAEEKAKREREENERCRSKSKQRRTRGNS